MADLGLGDGGEGVGGGEAASVPGAEVVGEIGRAGQVQQALRVVPSVLGRACRPIWSRKSLGDLLQHTRFFNP